MRNSESNGLRLAGLLSGGLLLLGLTYGLDIRIPCPFKTVTGFPCPGCGGMRALDALLLGKFGEALSINPLSCLLIAAFVAACIWLSVDWMLGRNTFSNAVRQLGNRYALPAVVVLLAAGWCRNILAAI